VKETLFFENVAVEIASQKQILGGVELIPNNTTAYLIATMLHSLPASNKRNRAFSYKTLLNSYKSIPNQRANVEHQMAYLDTSITDKQIGHIVAVDIEILKNTVAVPEKPVAVKVAIAMYKTNEDATKILNDIATKKDTWSVSMECLYDEKNVSLYWNGQFYPITSATEDMKACIASNRVDNYNGKPMYFCPGGEDGEISFSGIALTKSPADKNAKIISLLSSFGEGNPLDSNIKILIASDGTERGTRFFIEGNEVTDFTELYFNCYKNTGNSLIGTVDCSYGREEKREGGFVESEFFRLKQINKEVNQSLVADFKSCSASEFEIGAKWTRSFINDLPDSAFAVIEPAYKAGETTNKNARHLPHHNSDGSIDDAHLRNANARVNQILPITDSITKEELRTSAIKHLSKHKLENEKGGIEMTQEEVDKKLAEQSKMFEKEKVVALETAKAIWEAEIAFQKIETAKREERLKSIETAFCLTEELKEMVNEIACSVEGDKKFERLVKVLQSLKPVAKGIETASVGTNINKGKAFVPSSVNGTTAETKIYRSM